MANASDIISELRSGGEVDSEGQFTLDRDMARRKLHSFQLVEPLSYVLLLVQAAVLKGAHAIQFDVGGFELRMQFDGRQFTKSELEGIYDETFAATQRKDESSDDAEARRHLAWGLGAAISSQASLVSVESGNTCLELRPNKPDRLNALAEPATGTRIRVRRPYSSFRRFFASLSGDLVEERLLRERCFHSRVQISLSDKRISYGLVLADGEYEQTFQAPNLRGVLRFIDSEIVLACSLRIVQHGVLLEDHRPIQLLSNFVVAVETSRIRRDISLTKVVTDDLYDAMLAHALAAQIDWLASQCQRVLNGESHAPLDRLRGLLFELLARQVSGESMQRAWSLGAHSAFLQLPLIVSCQETLQPLSLLIDEISSSGSLRHSSETGPLPPGTKLVILRGANPPQLINQLERLFARTAVDVTPAVLAEKTREANLRRWQNRPVSDTLWHGPYIVHAPIAGPGVKGEVGWQPEGRPGLRLLIVKDGHLLFEGHWSAFSLPLEAVVSADFATNYTLETLIRDAQWRFAVMALWQGLTALCTEITAKLHQHVESALLGPGLRRLLIDVADSKLRILLFQQAAWPGEPTVEKNYPRELDEPTLSQPPDALWDVPLFVTFDKRMFSLRTLREHVAQNGMIILADPERQPLCELEWNALYSSGKTAREPLDVPIFLSIHEREKKLPQLLQKWLNSDRVINAPDWLISVRKLKQQAKRSPNYESQSIGTELAVSFRDRGLRGELGYRRRVALTDGELMVSLFRDGMHLARQAMYLPGGEDLIATIDTSFLQLQGDGTCVADNADLGRVREALAQALPQLLEKLVGGHEKIKCFTYAHLLQSMLSAIFPLPLFRDAYEALCQKLDLARAQQEYRALLQLVAEFGVEAVERPLRWYLSTEGPLPITLIANSLQKRLPEWDGVPYVPEVPGGLHWLDVLFPDPLDMWLLHERALQPLPILLDAPLFKDTRGQPLSLKNLTEELGKNGFIRYRKDAKVLPKFLSNETSTLAIADSATQKLVFSLFSSQQLRAETDSPPLLETPRPLGQQDIDAFFAEVLDGDDEPEPEPRIAYDVDEESLDDPQPLFDLSQIPFPAPPPIAPAPKNEPEEIFRQAILSELEHAGEFDARLLSGINLSRLVVGDAAENIAVLCNAQKTLLNRRHPLIKRGITDPSVASRWRFFAVSAVYTALNEFLQEVTDVDEAVFLHWLSQRMAALD